MNAEDLPEKVRERLVVAEDGCWHWTAALDRDGYGRFWDGTRKCVAHRITWELLVGPIPQGLVIDHLCRVRKCVNPEHLEPVKSSVNILRGEGPAARHARQSACKRGHDFTPENIEPHGPDGKARKCRRCANAARRARSHGTSIEIELSNSA